MHWLEEWMRNECSLTPKPECRSCRDLCAPKILLARNTGTPMRIIDCLIWDGWVTHPNFANAIADFTGASPQQRDMIVPEKYRGQWKPSGRKKKQAGEMQHVDASNRKWKDRPVVLINRSGAEKKRFAGAQAAADYAGKGRNYIYSRCERRISKKTDEFARTEESYRWADEWDRMSAEERAEDVRNKYRESGKCTCSAMPRVFKYQGECHTIAEWARICMLPESSLRERIKAGWDIEKAIKTPLRVYGQYKRKTNETCIDQRGDGYESHWALETRNLHRTRRGIAGQRDLRGNGSEADASGNGMRAGSPAARIIAKK